MSTKRARVSYNWTSFKQLLLTHYSAPQARIFKVFRNGAIAFGIGLSLVFYAHSSVPPSLQQELLVGAGMLIGGFGFVIAMTAQIRMLISRILHIFRK